MKHAEWLFVFAVEVRNGLVAPATIRRRSDYIIGFVTPAIGPNKFKKLTRLIAPVHNERGKVWMKNNIHGFTDNKRGTPDRRGFPDRTVQPRPDSGHGAIFCINRGSVRSGVKKTGRVGNGVVFLSVRVPFFGPGLNFDCSEIIYTNE